MFAVAEGRELRDCGTVALEPGEQVTFVLPSGAEYDVARTRWGFYATPSLNARLAGQGLRGTLVRNAQGKYYVMLVERGSEDAFAEDLRSQGSRLVSWLDDEASLAALDHGP